MAADRAGPQRPARRGSPAPGHGEIYLEYSAIGGQVRLAAIDAATGVEVVVFGPASVNEGDLARIAVRKLKRRIAALAAEGREPAPAAPAGRSRLV